MLKGRIFKGIFRKELLLIIGEGSRFENGDLLLQIIFQFEFVSERVHEISIVIKS